MMTVNEYVDKFSCKIYDAFNKKNADDLFHWIDELIQSLFDEFNKEALQLDKDQTADDLIDKYNSKCNDIRRRMEILWGPCPFKEDAFLKFIEVKEQVDYGNSNDS